jgi:hypothetical protein
MKRYGRVGLSGKERVREEALFGSGNTSVEFILSDEKKSENRLLNMKMMIR